MTDPISDFFIRIKNAQRAGHEYVRIPHSRFKQEIVKVLERANLVGPVERRGRRIRKTLEVALLYPEGKPAITGAALISRPGRRIFAGYRELPRARRGGVVIVTTPKGVMISSEARKQKLGGEVLAEVW